MALFGIVFEVVALVLIGIGFAIGLVAAASASVLVALGVVSSSFVVALRTGKAGNGIRAFLIQCGILAGIPAGAVCAWMGQVFFEVFGRDWKVWAYGAVGGAFAGLLVALMVDFVSRRLQAWASTKLALQ